MNKEWMGGREEWMHGLREGWMVTGGREGRKDGLILVWPAKFRETFREIFISHFAKFLNYFRKI
jgi:hypothetical protein